MKMVKLLQKIQVLQMVVSLQKIQVLQMFMILNIHADMETKKPTVRTYVKLWTDWAQVLINLARNESCYTEILTTYL
ncbi:hypothetical protein HanXRQr2_Chr14g0645991 [Helianthus annuus]|nr:hypothetical protein HanXRQr2_Chr14g0645991 [Helianthus annuus]KAJ0840528.1 hypothetical protein HanPSC8_Chr14g0619861 [Helianthus annuus]